MTASGSLPPEDLFHPDEPTHPETHDRANKIAEMANRWLIEGRDEEIKQIYDLMNKLS